MQRLFKRVNPVITAAILAAYFMPTTASAQGDGVRGYFDFFDNLCYPCTGPIEDNPYCTCMVSPDAVTATAPRG